jgi:DNA-binding transcriptional ArsR family regulator
MSHTGADREIAPRVPHPSSPRAVSRVLRIPVSRRSIYNLMVVDQVSDDEVDRLFHALADRTRRDIVRRVLVGEHSVSALARNYPVSVTAVQKHVAVLEEAGLVVKHRHGREQRVTGQPDAIRRAQELLAAYEELWRGRFDRMADLLDEDKQGENA